MTLLLALLLLQSVAPASPADTGTEAGRAEAERLFAIGTALIAEGDTSGAVAAWQGAAGTGWTSAAVEHNLGTVALARGETAAARLHLERAARLDPLDDGIARNLGLARQRVGEPEPSAVRAGWTRVVAVVRPLGLVALALALAFGALGLMLGGRRRLASGLGAVALVAVGAAGLAVWERTRPLGVVLVEDAAVLDAPSPSAGGVTRLRAGEAVGLGDAADGWQSVRLGRNVGWVREDAVAPI